MEAANDGVSWSSKGIEGANQHRRCGTYFELLTAADANQLLADLGCRDGSGGGEENIAVLPDIALGLSAIESAQLLRLKIVSGGDQTARLKQGKDFRPELGSTMEMRFE